MQGAIVAVLPLLVAAAAAAAVVVVVVVVVAIAVVVEVPEEEVGVIKPLFDEVCQYRAVSIGQWFRQQFQQHRWIVVQCRNNHL